MSAALVMPIAQGPAMPADGRFRYVQDWLTEVCRHPRLKGQEAAKDILREVADAGGSKGWCFLSDKLLAERTGWHEGTIKRAVLLIQRLGLLARIERGTSKGHATVYVLPLVRDSAPKGGAGAMLPESDGRPTGPQRGAPVSAKGGAGAFKGERNGAPPTHYGTHDGTHHGSGSPDRSESEAERAPGPPRPGAGAGIKAWLSWALDVAASGAGPGTRRRAASEAAGATFGRLKAYGPSVVEKPLREAMSGSEADRRRLLAAAANADYLLKMGKSAEEAGKRFGAVWKGTAQPHFEPMPGSEAAEAARRPEPGAVRRGRGSEARGGGLVALAESLDSAGPGPGPELPIAVGRPPAEAPPSPPPAGSWGPLPEAELRKRLPGAWERLSKAWNLPPDGGMTP